MLIMIATTATMRIAAVAPITNFFFKFLLFDIKEHPAL